MKAYTAQQIRDAEAPLLAAGVPLMRRAAAALAAEIAGLLPHHRSGRVLLVVGSGNNGGDALFAGAELARSGNHVEILPVSERMHDEGLLAALDEGARMLEADTDAAAAASAESGVFHADVVVDAILGTGAAASPMLRGRARVVVAAMLPAFVREKHPVVVAVDLPSGVDPDTGDVADPTVLRADVTVTFGACKRGLLRHPASDFTGRIVVADIGLGAELERLAALE